MLYYGRLEVPNVSLEDSRLWKVPSYHFASQRLKLAGCDEFRGVSTVGEAQIAHAATRK